MPGTGIFDTELAADAVADATGLGQRAAAWTACAALHSGIFIRPQLRAWLRIPRANFERAEASRIIASLRDLGLATEDELGGIGRCVHIHAKQVYRALGETDNRNRRRPGREKAIERLLCLDYVLDHPEEPWLPTEGGKTQACEEAGIDHGTWPRKVYPAQDGESETTRFFVEKFPLAVDVEGRRAVAACVSPGTTKARLTSWLEAYGPLLEALAGAGFALSLVHISQRPEMAEPAARQLETAARRLSAGDADEAELERIRNAIRACTQESLESVGGLSEALETARKIFARRGKEPAGTPVRVSTQAWTSTRIAEPESGA